MRGATILLLSVPQTKELYIKKQQQQNNNLQKHDNDTSMLDMTLNETVMLESYV